MDKSNLAYQAGLFDGEGAIYMTGRLASSSVVVTFTNTNLELCRIYADQWGGKINHQIAKSIRAKQIHRWYKAGKNSIPFITAMLPYLIAKRQVALLALEYMAIKCDTKPMPADIIRKRLTRSTKIYQAQQRQRLI